MNDFQLGREFERLAAKVAELDRRHEGPLVERIIDMSKVAEHVANNPPANNIVPVTIVDGEDIIYAAPDLRWAWYYVGFTAGRYRVTFTNVPGANPIGGCCSEWDTRNNRPFFGDAHFYLLSAERSTGQVRVEGSHSYTSALHCGCGYITA